MGNAVELRKYVASNPSSDVLLSIIHATTTKLELMFISCRQHSHDPYIRSGKQDIVLYLNSGPFCGLVLADLGFPEKRDSSVSNVIVEKPFAAEIIRHTHIASGSDFYYRGRAPILYGLQTSIVSPSSD